MFVYWILDPPEHYNKYCFNRDQNRIMIREILLKSKSRKDLYKNKLICGCMYRSFNDLESSIFFRFTANNGRLSIQNINEMVSQDRSVGAKEKIMSIIEIFRNLDIVENDHGIYRLNAEFCFNVEEFLKNEIVMNPVTLKDKEKPPVYEPEPYEFLEILLDNKLPRRCKVQGLSEYSQTLSKEQFMYIKSDISYKIGILVDGIINKESENVRNIENIVLLNLLDSEEYYVRRSELNGIIEELSKIKLVQIAGPNGEYFRISKYLEHFTFKKWNQQSKENKMKCRIIIETNFKVFAVIKASEREASVIKRILSMLLYSTNEGVVYQELFIGEINSEFMKDRIFRKTGITTNEYFDFFKQYTDEMVGPPKDLGKWKKLKYIGLEGPSELSNIPSNVRQEVKLWEYLKDQRDDDKDDDRN